MNLERVAVDAGRLANRLEAPVVRELRAQLNRASRVIAQQLQPRLASSLGAMATQEANRILREATARGLIAQLDVAYRALDLNATTGRVLDRAITEAAREGAADAERLLRLAAARVELPASGAFTAALPLDQVAAQVQLARARLTSYANETVNRINDVIIDGLIAGKNPRAVARNVRAVIVGEAPGHGGLAFKAERLARTEIMSSVNDARLGAYRARGVQRVVWLATPDERTCEACSARSGRIYRIEDVTIPAHPACRCTTAPADAVLFDNGFLTRDDITAHQELVRAEYALAHDGRAPTVRLTPFEKAAGLTSPPASIPL